MQWEKTTENGCTRTPAHLEQSDGIHSVKTGPGHDTLKHIWGP